MRPGAEGQRDIVPISSSEQDCASREELHWQCLIRFAEALAFRGRSPSVTKRATHPSVHRVKSTLSGPSAYSGSGMRSITLLAPSCATDQDLASSR